MSNLRLVSTHVLMRRGEHLSSLHEQVRQEAHALDRAIELLMSERNNKRLVQFIESPVVRTWLSALEERMQEIDFEVFDRKCEAEDLAYGRAA